MAQLLYRLGAFGVRRRRLLLLVWPLVVAAVAVAGIAFAGSFQSSSSIPGSPAQTALVRMDQHFPSPDVQSAQIVFQAPAGHAVTETAYAGPITAMAAAARGVPGVSNVSDALQDGSVSPDGRTAMVQAEFAVPSASDVAPATLDALRAAGRPAEQAGLRVVYGGDAYKVSASTFGTTEIVSILVALMVLVVTFGSLLAAGMPLLTALIGVIVTVTGMVGLSSLVGISDNAPTLALMLGLAVGIDYALFIVSRHRSQLATGMPVGESVARAVASAGSAVVFAGATVVIALCGLTVARVPVLTSMGLAAAGAVAVAVLMSLGLLPALLGAAGARLTPRPGSRAARRTAESTRTTAGVRYVTAVTRRPLLSAVAATIGLLVLAAPATQLDLALTDNGSEVTSSATRQGYDLISQAFGPGANGPLVVLVTNPDPAGLKAAAEQVTSRLQGVRGIADVSEVDLSDDGVAARVQVTPATGPRDPATSDLVNRLRTLVRPAGTSTGSYVAVTGLTAVSIDVSAKLSGALLPFAVVVVGLSLLLLMLAFRSIAVPLKATVGFLLSVSASFGVTVAVFQWGWLSSLLGTPSVGPVASFVPIIVMAVLFGLAMDYEVFLVSSMREDYVRTRDSRASVLTGARSAARVVTAAALIMVAVFIGFVLSKDPDIMPIAFALAVGVLLDAFVVRMTLVPAVLTLLGDRAWWLPGWLDRRLPDLDVEGHLPAAPPEPAPAAVGQADPVPA